MTHPDYPDTLPADAFAPDAPAPEPIAFTPVPRRRNRRSGWSEARQRGFIAALAQCGSVSAAARQVGMTARTAYKLLDAEGAASFAEAWDAAIEQGFARVESDALERALNGSFVPIYRRGKLVQVEHRRNDRLAISILKAHDTRVDEFRSSAVSRCHHHTDMRLLEGLRDERAARLARVEEEYHTAVDRLTDEAIGRMEQRGGYTYDRRDDGPRIRAL